jgi:hypothetical protein
LLAAFGVAVLASLGPRLTIDGRQSFRLPWSVVANWPLFDNVLSERLALYVSLATAVIVALWTAARPPGLGRWLLPGLALLAIGPNLATDAWATRYSVPAFFTDRAYSSCLDPGETILPLPGITSNEALLWQTAAGYRFRMTAGGMLSAVVPPAFAGDAFATQDFQLTAPGDVPEMQAFIKAHGVTTVVADQTMAPLWEPPLNNIAPPHVLGGVLVWQVSGTPASCLGAP